MLETGAMRKSGPHTIFGTNAQASQEKASGGIVGRALIRMGVRA